MSKIELEPITTGYRSSQRISGNFEAIEEAFENTLSRDGTTPNFMQAQLDMNSNRIINGGAPISGTDYARLVDVQALAAGVDVVDVTDIVEDLLPGIVGSQLANKADVGLANVNNAVFLAKADEAGVGDDKADIDLTNVSNEDFLAKADAAGVGGGSGGTGLPNQAGNSGKFLTTNGAITSWSNPVAGYLKASNNLNDLTNIPNARASLGFPGLTGNEDKILSNNGTSFVWVDPGSSGVNSTGFPFVDDYRLPTDTNDTPAFVAALAANTVVYLKAKTYSVSGPITLTKDGHSIIGAGFNSTIIECSQPNSSVIRNNIALTGLCVRDLTVKHTTTATSGGVGIDFGRTGSSHRIFNVRSTNNFIGFWLGGTDFSLIKDCKADHNASIGFYLFGNVDNQNLQWIVNGCLSELNGNQGYLIESNSAISSSTTCGTFVNCSTYANLSSGLSAKGYANNPLNGVRVHGGFYGEDGAYGIYLDTFAGLHVLRPDFIELSNDAGIGVTNNNKDVVIQLGHCGQNKYEGVVSYAEYTQINGGQFTNNGRGLIAGRRSGIAINAGTADITNVSTYSAANAATQQYGISSNVTELLVVGSNLNGNVTDPTYFPGSTAAFVVTGCRPTSVNTGGGEGENTITGNLVVSGNIIASGDVQGSTLHVTGASAFAGDLNVTGAHTIYVNSGGVVAHDANFSHQLEVGGGIAVGGPVGGVVSNKVNVKSGYLVDNVALGSGGSGNLVTGNLTVTGNIIGQGDIQGQTLHVVGASAFAGDVNVTGSSTIYVNNGGVVAKDIAVFNGLVVTNYITVGGASAQTGRVNTTAGYSVNGTPISTSSNTITGNLTVSGAITAGTNITATSGNITSSSGNVTGVNVYGTSAVVSQGNMYVSGGGSLYINAGGAVIGNLEVPGSITKNGVTYVNP